MNNEEDKSIPSPYSAEDFKADKPKQIPEVLMDKVKALVEEYGYKDCLLMVHDRNELTEQCNWIACSSVISDCLIANLEKMTSDFGDILEDEKEK